MILTNGISTSQADAMLAAIAAHDPRPSYDRWLSIIGGTVAAVGPDAACELLARHFPEEKTHEYARRANGFRKYSAGTLIYLARQAGYAGTGTTFAVPHAVPRPACRAQPAKIILGKRHAEHEFIWREYTYSKYERGLIREVWNCPIDMAGEPDCGERYQSFYMFTDEIIEYREKHKGEPDNKSGMALYSGPVWCDRFQVDLDSKNDLQAAQKTAVQWLRGLDDPRVKAYFTGGKGFRLIYPAGHVDKANGYEQTPELLKRYAIALHKQYGGIEPDLSIYRTINLIRVPNSQHSSGLYMVELVRHEIEILSVDEIKILASSQRTL